MIGQDTNGAPGTEHQSVFSGGHQDWRAGISCDECRTLHAERKAQHGGQKLLVSGLASMRDKEYSSVYALEKEAIADARANGIEPERYSA